jgi:hypothetical protein
MVAGDIVDSRHRPWDCSAAQAIERIAEEWIASGDVPLTPGAIVWLDLTPAGKAIGERVLAREASRQSGDT